MNCIFCNIVSGAIPCYKVYEDELFLGFLDIRPLNPGNSLLIPKKHYRWVYDVPQFGTYWEIARKIGIHTLPVVKAHSLNFLTLGYEVPHAHIRIVPRFEDDGHSDGIRLSAVKKINDTEMSAIAEKTRKSISS